MPTGHIFKDTTDITGDNPPVIHSIPTGPVTLSFSGNFGAATKIAIEQKIDGVWFALLNGSKAPVAAIEIIFASADLYNLYGGSEIRFVVTAADANTDIRYTLNYG